MSLSTLERTLDALASGAEVSGAALAERLGVSRTAVWKQIEQLRELGVEVDAEAGRGYRLAAPIERLDAERLASTIAARAPTLLRALDVHLTTDSTNADVSRRPPHDRHGYVCLAEHQAAGRGRRGRAWQSPLGANFYLSVGWRFERGAAALAGLSLAIGVAVAEALHALGYAEVGLKWPNDLVAHDRKLGGLLIELGGEWSGPSDAVVGIGINGRMPRSAGTSIDQPWIDLASLPRRFPLAGDSAREERDLGGGRNDLAAGIVARVLLALSTFERDGFAPFAARFDALDALRDRPIRVHRADGVFDAIARGIDANGLLLVESHGAISAQASGEVSVRVAA